MMGDVIVCGCSDWCIVCCWLLVVMDSSCLVMWCVCEGVVFVDCFCVVCVFVFCLFVVMNRT